MRNSAQQNRCGHTLVEMLVVAVLFSFFGVAVLILASSTRSTWLMAEAHLSTQTDAQRVVDRIREDLETTTAASVLAPGNCAGSSLQFVPIGSVAPVTYTFDPGAGTLTRSDGTTTRVVSAGLTAFAASCDANGVVRLQVTSRSQGQAPPVSQVLDARVWVQIPS